MILCNTHYVQTKLLFIMIDFEYIKKSQVWGFLFGYLTIDI